MHGLHMRAGRNDGLLVAKALPSIKIGASYATTGRFVFPNETNAEELTERMFVGPLCVVMVSIEFHPTATHMSQDRNNNYAQIAALRMDGVFGTSFGCEIKVTITVSTPTARG